MTKSNDLIVNIYAHLWVAFQYTCSKHISVRRQSCKGHV